MISSSVRKSLLVGIAGLSLTGAVAGCAPAVNPSADSMPATSSTKTQSAESSAPLAQTSGYKDGAFSADGAYTSPNGQESIGVQLTLTSGAVSAVEVTAHATNPMSQKFQGEFKDGIAAQIVGKKLDEIKVSKVAGSSLTSGGFNQALETIKAQAK